MLGFARNDRLTQAHQDHELTEFQVSSALAALGRYPFALLSCSMTAQSKWVASTLLTQASSVLSHWIPIKTCLDDDDVGQQ